MASPGKKAYPLRIDPAVWDALVRLAAAEMRSTNAQIEYLLREALARRGIRPGGEAPDQIKD
ncbi:hypothetical protein OPU71_17235 [Niveibacterium sp. 24ML]|uniref:hypothetical protein n=1 Tax=Niveibacterium sp. 24ML TaxID=2985512 RepID=UPI002270B26F|nr:hypothetical protein [Niveibacterium sp. 24ML]MCX9157870.1 hypothetical protein [Niveibacterium sp. 24ML]